MASATFPNPSQEAECLSNERDTVGIYGAGTYQERRPQKMAECSQETAEITFEVEGVLKRKLMKRETSRRVVREDKGEPEKESGSW